MPDPGGRQWPKVALSFPLVVTRGERLKNERRRKGLTQEQLEQLTGVSVRSIRRVEKNLGDDPRSLDILEAYFGLTNEQRIQSPRLADADDIDLVSELYRRLQAKSDTRTGQLPDDLDEANTPQLGPSTQDKHRKSDTGG